MLAYGFRCSFTPLAAVLFTFPSRYLFTVGRQLVFSLTPWSARIHAKFHVCRITQVPPRVSSVFGYGPLTLCGTTFLKFHLTVLIPYRWSYNPGAINPGLGFSAFVRHYRQNRFRFLFLWVLRCFTSPRLTLPRTLLRGVPRFDPRQVIPFGNPRVKASLPLSVAYRSLARPSSSAGAKAFTMR